MGVLKTAFLFFRALLVPKIHLAVENLALRQQLAVLKQASKRPKLRPRNRVFWAWLSRLWTDWRSALVIVEPDTVIHWHRQGFRLYWRWKSRARNPGRPSIEREIRDLIGRMFRENPTWGALRIESELRHDRRKVVHLNITAHPTALWTAQQIVEAFPFDEAPRYLIRDRDGSYGDDFRKRIRNMGIDEVVIAPRSPWQNPYCERVIGSIRRQCLHHIIVLDERHLKRVLTEYVAYYHNSRTHLSLSSQLACATPSRATIKGESDFDSPGRRAASSLRAGSVIADYHSRLVPSLPTCARRERSVHSPTDMRSSWLVIQSQLIVKFVRILQHEERMVFLLGTTG